jgi:hypothetical protein
MGIIVGFDYGAWLARYPEFIGNIPPPPAASFTASIDDSGNLVVSSTSSGTLTLDYLISGPGVKLGTYITQFTSTNNWIVNYPQTIPLEAMTAVLGQISPAQAQLYFNEATLYLRNDGTGFIDEADVQSRLLNMLVSHIAVRYAVLNGQTPSFTVGRNSQASQGPVSMSWDFQVPPGTAQWFAQTPYGADFWAATAGLRSTAFYRPGPRRNFNPWFYARPWGGNF